jgi:hypothetical protein
MNTYRVSYQNASDKVIRNKHKRVKANSADQAKQIVMQIGELIAVYKIEAV